MTSFQPPYDTYDGRVMISPDMADHIDPSQLMAFQASDAGWMRKDPFELMPWDMSVDEQQPYDLHGDYIADMQPGAVYVTSRHGSPNGYEGYSTRPEAADDVFSYSSPPSDRDSGSWSPTYKAKSGSQRPVSSNKQLAQPSRGHTIANLPPKRSVSSESTSSSSIKQEHRSPGPPRKSSIASSSSTTTTSKSSIATTDSDLKAVMKRKKAAHNAIEKRYRTNMNAKFVALGNVLPRSSCGGPSSFTQVTPIKTGLRKSSSSSLGRDGSTTAQQQSQNKSEILTNALTYILKLQEQNRLLHGELAVLKQNLLPGSGGAGGAGGMMWRSV